MVKRTSELKQIQSAYDEPRNQIVLLYGTHRSGLVDTVSEFVKGKKYFYYKARNASPKEQLTQLQQEIERFYDIKIQKDTYDECFNRIKSGDPTKLVLVIDGFHLVAKREPAFFESLLKLKKKQLYPGPVMILLLCDSPAWVTDDMKECLKDGADAIDYTYMLGDYHFLDIVRNFADYSVQDCVATYGILGGVSDYIKHWDGKAGIRKNVCTQILSPDGFLYTEAEDYIGKELRELSVYDTILCSMARGNEKLNDLFRDTGYSRAKISVYLKNLAAFDVIEKVVSFDTGGWDNTKKGIYRIKNHFIEFWFRFVYPHQSDLFVLTPEAFYDKYLDKELETYLSRSFSEICAEYLDLMNRMGKVPIDIKHMGTWIGKAGTIDIVAEDDERDHVVGICNWSDEELSYESYQDLLDNMKMAKLRAKAVYLFSAKDFDIKLKSMQAKGENIVLIDMTEL